MPQVIIEQPGVTPMTVAIAGGEVRFGRADDCDVVLQADEVSRHHAKISLRAGKMVLTDLKSLNGTYVNRQRIVERVLSHMDEIWFGSKCRIVYRDDTHFGREADFRGSAESDSQLVQNMQRIRAEMDLVGNSMTLIASHTPARAEETTTVPKPSPPPADLKAMGRAFRRMAALHKASQVMASNFDLHHRLSEVLDIIMEEVGADRGFVMLREEGACNLNVKVARKMGQDLEASSPSMGIAGRSAIDGEPVLMADREQDQEFGQRESIIKSRIASAMSVPLRIEKRILGSIYVDTRRSDVSFTPEDLELFASLAAQAAFAIDNVHLHQQVVEAEKKRQNFGRFLSPAVVDQILNENADIVLGGRKARVTTLFCDIRGSSQLAEQLAPQELVAALNEHFTAMTQIIFDRQGTLDKYIGDEIMAIFGAPIATGDEAFRAVDTALQIQALNRELNTLRKSEGRPLIQVGIGIETGDVIAGYIGSPMRMDFTVVGDRVNIAKRLCDLAGPGQVVAGYETWEEIKDRFSGRPIGTVLLKGKERPVTAYEILAPK